MTTFKKTKRRIEQIRRLSRSKKKGLRAAQNDKSAEQSTLLELQKTCQQNREELLNIKHQLELLITGVRVDRMQRKMMHTTQSRASNADILKHLATYKKSHKRAEAKLIMMRNVNAPSEHRSRFFKELYKYYWQDCEEDPPVKGAYVIQEQDASLPIGHFLYSKARKLAQAYRIFKATHSTVLISNVFVRAMYDYKRGTWVYKDDRKWQRRVMETKFESHIDVKLKSVHFKVYFLYSFECFFQDRSTYFTFVKMEREGNRTSVHSKNAIQRYTLRTETTNKQFREDCFIEGNCDQAMWRKQNIKHGWHTNDDVIHYTNHIRTGDEIFIPDTPETQHLFRQIAPQPSSAQRRNTSFNVKKMADRAKNKLAMNKKPKKKTKRSRLFFR